MMKDVDCIVHTCNRNSQIVAVIPSKDSKDNLVWKMYQKHAGTEHEYHLISIKQLIGKDLSLRDQLEKFFLLLFPEPHVKYSYTNNGYNKSQGVFKIWNRNENINLTIEGDWKHTHKFVDEAVETAFGIKRLNSPKVSFDNNEDCDWYTDTHTYKVERIKKYDYGFKPKPAKKLVDYKPPSEREL